MAYSNEQSVELAKIQKNNRGDFIIATKITGATGNVSVDIRQYYTDDNDDILPTKKGVRFSAENLLEIMKALTEVLETDEKEELVDFLNEVIKDEEDDTEDEDNEDEEDDN